MCVECGESFDPSCSTCCQENPCKYGKVIGEIEQGDYIKITKISEADCKENIKIDGPEIISSDGSVDADYSGNTWDLTVKFPTDRNDKVALYAGDTPGYLSDKLDVCGNGILTMDIVGGKLEFCVDEDMIPQPDGKIKVNPDCDFAYASEVILAGEGIQIDATGCEIIISEAPMYKPMVRIFPNELHTFIRNPELSGGSLPGTGTYNTTVNFGHFGIPMDGISYQHPDFQLVDHSIPRMSGDQPSIKAVRIPKTGYYRINNHIEYSINYAVNAHRIWTGSDLSLIILDTKPGEQAGGYSDNPFAPDNDPQWKMVRTGTNDGTVLLQEGELVFPGGRLSTAVDQGPGANQQGEMTIYHQPYGIGMNSNQTPLGFGISCYFEVEWVCGEDFNIRY